MAAGRAARGAVAGVKLRMMGNLGHIRRVLRHRDFRFLWLAQSSSVIGDRIVTVALALFIISRTGSATDLGIVLAAYSLPLVGFLLIGGVWADRLPRHRVMIVTDLVRFALHGLLAVLIFAGSVEIWQLVVIEALFGTAEAFFRPAATGVLPQTVPETEIQQAKAVIAMFNNIAEFVGPAAATALVLGAGAGSAFTLDAATFGLSAAALTQIRPRVRAAPQEASAAPARGTVWRAIREGAREVRSRAWVWGTLAAFCAALFTGLAPWFVLGPVVAREQYGHVAVYGVVAAAFGLGTIAGALLGAGWRPRFPMRCAMLAILVWPLSLVLYAVGLSLVIVIPVTVLAGGGFALFDVWWETALAERIPPDKLSRVSSYDWMVSFALLPLGFVLAGPLAGAFGAVTILLGGSLLALVSLTLGLLPRETRTLERLAMTPEHGRAEVDFLIAKDELRRPPG